MLLVLAVGTHHPGDHGRGVAGEPVAVHGARDHRLGTRVPGDAAAVRGAPERATHRRRGARPGVALARTGSSAALDGYRGPGRSAGQDMDA